jgi:hypothetical protein
MTRPTTCLNRASTTAHFQTSSKNIEVSVIKVLLLSRNSLLTKAVAENDTHDHGDYSSVPPFTTDIDEPQAISVEYEEQYDRRMGKGSWGRRRHVKSHYVRPHPFTKTASVKKELRRAAVNPRDAFKEADADAERNSGHVFWDFTNCRIAVSLARFCWKTSPAAAWLEELLRTPSQPDIEMDAEDDSEIDTDEDSEIDPDGDSETDATRDARCQGYCTHDGRRDVPPQPCQRMF